MHETPYSVTGVWNQPWNEAGLCAWAENLRRRLGPRTVTFGLLFVTPRFFPHAAELLEILRVHAHIPVLAGCSTLGLIADGREIEEGTGFVLGLYSLPEAKVRAVHVGSDIGAESVLAEAGIDAAAYDAVLAFAEPFRTDVEPWLNGVQAALPGVPVYGGLAAGRGVDETTQVYCDGSVFDEGGVVLAIGGVRCIGVTAQGCAPVGDTWTITRAERNIIRQIGNRPAVEVLTETFEGLSDEEKERSGGNLFVGLVVDEYRDDYQRGDFLIRSLIAADPDSGSILVGALPRSGQTLQFQLRDARAAHEDFVQAVNRLRAEVGRAEVFGGCMSICAGRGQALFGEADHDAGILQEAFGTIGMVGFFGNGEFGPVGGRSHVHAYAATVLLFAGPEQREDDDL